MTVDYSSSFQTVPSTTHPQEIGYKRSLNDLTLQVMKLFNKHMGKLVTLEAGLFWVKTGFTD